MTQYFSDREQGPAPLTLDEITDTAWGGIVSLYVSAVDCGAFGHSFPDECSDPERNDVIGTNRYALTLRLRAEIPAIGDQIHADEHPGTVAAMDFVEFCWDRIAEPRVRSRHDYFEHNHLAFNVDRGRTQWRKDVNRILSRNGIAFELDDAGQAVRVGSAAAVAALSLPLPLTSDAQFDDKIATAIKKYHDPDVNVRREALEALWDAFERLKTLLAPEKPSGSSLLVNAVTTQAATQARLTTEFKELTQIGNEYAIRHHETGTLPVEDSLIDYFFVRALALIDTVIRASY